MLQFIKRVIQYLDLGRSRWLIRCGSLAEGTSLFLLFLYSGNYRNCDNSTLPSIIHLPNVSNWNLVYKAAYISFILVVPSFHCDSHDGNYKIYLTNPVTSAQHVLKVTDSHSAVMQDAMKLNQFATLPNHQVLGL